MLLRTSLRRVLRVPLRVCSTQPSAGTNGHLLYNEQHWQLRHSVKQFIQSDINPNVDKWEAEGAFPAKQLFKKLGALGVFGIDRAVEYGGSGLDFSYCIAVAEELGNIDCGGIPMAIGVQANMATPALAHFGSDYLKDKFLRPTISGDLVSCLGVSEVSGGSDVAALVTTAVQQGDELVINGGKMWTTNGDQADWMCLLANTSQNGAPHMNKSLICLPLDLPGVSKSSKLDKLGMRCSDTVQYFFEDVRVPVQNVIGNMGNGFTYQMMQFQDERLIATALALAAFDNMVSRTIDFARDRKIFSKSVLDHQVVHFNMAELQTEIEALRALLYRAVYVRLSGEDATLLASMCKLKTGRLSRQVSDQCLQYWGGMGFMDDNYVARLYRDFRVLSIGGGADEVMLSIICKYMRILPKS